MQTTLEVPDALYLKMKATTATKGQSVASFIVSAIQEKIATEDFSSNAQQWMRFAGIFRKDSTESSRIMQRIEEDCEQICAEDWR